MSVVLFGLLMDLISQEVAAEELGVAIEGTSLIISTLLWVDDVVIVETNKHNMLRILYLVNHVAKKYHLEFGEVKSKVLKIGKGPERPNFTLGDMELQYVEKYKYLGYTQNNTNTIEDHLNSIKGKVEAAYQKTLALALNPTLKWIEMETIWTTVDTCILPIITCAGEIFIIRNKKNEAAINRLLENIIKRILRVPIGTPTEALYIETGIIRPTAIIQGNGINMHKRIMTNNNEWMQQIISENKKTGWIQKTRELEEDINITNEELKGSRNAVKKNSREKCKRKLSNENRRSKKQGKR